MSLNIGMIGLDTSHVIAFTDILNNTDHPYHVEGAKIVVAYSKASPDFELSYSREGQFKQDLQDRFQVNIVTSIAEVAEQSDAIFITSVDGRVHLEQFREVAPYGKPVYIDKPLTVSYEEAVEIRRLAEDYKVPVMSSSSLRFSESFTKALQELNPEDIIGIDCYGPMAIQPTQPGLFWYGIHMVEMLYTCLGSGCATISAVSNEDQDIIIGIWKDGRIGTIRGNRNAYSTFSAAIHHKSGVTFIDIAKDQKPFYAGLVESVMQMFTTGKASVDINETLEIIRFIEVANKCRESSTSSPLL